MAIILQTLYLIECQLVSDHLNLVEWVFLFFVPELLVLLAVLLEHSASIWISELLEMLIYHDVVKCWVSGLAVLILSVVNVVLKA